MLRFRCTKNNVPVIGVTGGISTGKSSFCAAMRELLPVATFFDADQAARESTDHDPEVRESIEQEFGPEIYSADGDLNRARLRSIVFADADKKRALEQILHPRIRRQWALAAQSRRNSPELFFADIPLLYETGGESLCNRVVVVACSASVQRERLMKRAALDQATAEQMIAAQMPLAEKIRRANHVIWNNGGPDVLGAQVTMLANYFQAIS